MEIAVMRSGAGVYVRYYFIRLLLKYIIIHVINNNNNNNNNNSDLTRNRCANYNN